MTEGEKVDIPNAWGPEQEAEKTEVLEHVCEHKRGGWLIAKVFGKWMAMIIVNNEYGQGCTSSQTFNVHWCPRCGRLLRDSATVPYTLGEDAGLDGLLINAGFIERS